MKWNLVAFVLIFLVSIVGVSAAVSNEQFGVGTPVNITERNDCGGVIFKVNQTMNITKVCVGDGVTATQILVQNITGSSAIMGNASIVSGCADFSASPVKLSPGMGGTYADYAVCAFNGQGGTAFQHRSTCSGAECDDGIIFITLYTAALRIGCYSGEDNINCYGNDDEKIWNIANITLSNEAAAVDQFPQYKEQYQNATTILTGGAVKISWNWTDDIGLNQQVASFWNTTHWTNATGSLTGLANTTTLNMALNTVGVWSFKFYANDTLNQWNVTSPLLNVTVTSLTYPYFSDCVNNISGLIFPNVNVVDVRCRFQDTNNTLVNYTLSTCNATGTCGDFWTGGYIPFTNCTTTKDCQANFSFIPNSPGVWGWQTTACNSVSLCNTSGLYNFTVTPTAYPQWYFNYQNATTVPAGSQVQFISNASDVVNLSMYIPSYWNSTHWINSSLGIYFGTYRPCAVNYTDCRALYTPFMTYAGTFRMKFFANNSGNYWNVSPIMNVTVTDSTPPTYYFFTGNTTSVVGTTHSVKVVANWTDNNALRRFWNSIQSPTTGLWINLSVNTFPAFICGPNCTSTETSLTALGTWRFKFYVNDTVGNEAVSGTWNVSVNADTTAPQWTLNTTINATAPIYVQQPLRVYATWTDDAGLGYFVWSYSLGGVWRNVTAAFTTDESGLNFIPELNESGTWQFKIFANDTSNNWNVTDVLSVEILDLPSWWIAYYGYDSYYGVDNFRFPTILHMYESKVQKNYARNPNQPILVSEFDGDMYAEELVTFGYAYGSQSVVRIYENTTLDLIGSYGITDGSLSNAVIFANYSGANTNSLLFAVETENNPQLYEVRIDLVTGLVTNYSTNITSWFNRSGGYDYAGGQLALGCDTGDGNRTCYLFYNKYNYSEYNDYTSGVQVNDNNILAYIKFNSTGNIGNANLLLSSQNTSCFSKYRNVPFYDYDDDGQDEWVLSTVAMNEKVAEAPWWCVPPLTWILGDDCGSGTANWRNEKVHVYVGGERIVNSTLGNYISWSQNATVLNPETGENETVSGYNVSSGLSTYKSLCYQTNDPAANRIYSDASSAVSNPIMSDMSADGTLDLIIAESNSQWSDQTANRDFSLMWMDYPYNSTDWDVFDASGSQGDFSNIVESNVYQNAVEDGEICAYGFAGDHSGILCGRMAGGKKTYWFELDGSVTNTAYFHDMTTSIYSIRSNSTYDDTETQNLTRFVTRTGVLQPTIDWWNNLGLEYNFSLSAEGFEFPIISPIVDSGYSDLVVLTDDYLYYLDDGVVDGTPTATWGVTPCFVQDGAYTPIRQWQKMMFQVTGTDHNEVLPQSYVITNATLYFTMKGGHGNYSLDLYEDNDEFQITEIEMDNSGLGTNGVSVEFNITDVTGLYNGFAVGTIYSATGITAFPTSGGVGNDTFVEVWEATTPTIAISLRDPFNATDNHTLTYGVPETMYVNNGTAYNLTFVGMKASTEAAVFNLTTAADPTFSVISVAGADGYEYGVLTTRYNWSITLVEREYPSIIYAVTRSVTPFTVSSPYKYSGATFLLNLSNKLNWTTDEGDWAFKVCVEDYTPFSTCYRETFEVATSGTEWMECWTGDDYELYTPVTTNNQSMTEIIQSGMESLGDLMQIGMSVLWIILMIIFTIIIWVYLHKNPWIAGICTFLGVLIFCIIGNALGWISGGIFLVIMLILVGAAFIILKGKVFG